jgi:hypothetical protein
MEDEADHHGAADPAQAFEALRAGGVGAAAGRGGAAGRVGGQPAARLHAVARHDRVGAGGRG